MAKRVCAARDDELALNSHTRRPPAEQPAGVSDRGRYQREGRFLSIETTTLIGTEW
jgi:hypothetical protein